MGNVVAFILALVAPIVIKAIAAAGITAVVFVGVDTMVGAMNTYAQTAWSSLPVNVLQLATLSGIPDCMGLILGAYFTRFTMQFATGAAKFVFKP